MIKVTGIVTKVLRKYPLYAEALAHGIVNYSALARILKKEVQDERMENVSHEAIAIALKRCVPEQRKHIAKDKSIQPVQGLSIRTGISVVSYEKSPQIGAKYQKLLSYSEKLDNVFLHYDLGMRDVNIILTEELLPDLKKITAGEKLLIVFHECSLIVITLPHESLNYPGVCERFFRILAWEQVNIITFFQTYGELAFVVEREDAQKAYEFISILAKLR